MILMIFDMKFMFLDQFFKFSLILLLHADAAVG